MSLTSIISSPQNVPSTYAPDVNRSGNAGAPVTTTSSTATDQASLSSTSGLVAQAIGGSESDVRTDKIAALQQAISGGTYNVSSGQVAGKIIDSLLG